MGASVKASRRDCAAMPLQTFSSGTRIVELPKSAIKTDESPGSFDYAPFSVEELVFRMRSAQDHRLKHHVRSLYSFVFLRVLCGYFLFFFVGVDDGCAPVTLAST